MGIVYMLGYENLYYIGSTLETMKQRIHKHKNAYKRWLNKKRKYYNSSFDIIKNEGYEVIEIEEVIGETEEECRFREQCWMDFYGKENLVNKMNASGYDTENSKKNHKEYFERNKIYINKKRKDYRDNNKEKIKEKQQKSDEKRKEQKKEYYKINKEKINQRNKEYREKQKLLLNSNNLNITTTD